MPGNFNPTGTLTGANAIVILTIQGLFPAPFQLQQFAADDITDIEGIEAAETMMGVDGTLSAGFTYKPYDQKIKLMANSPSIVYFDTCWGQQQQNQDVYRFDGTITLPAINMKYTLTNGYLTRYTGFPGVKKLLQPRDFEIKWNMLIPQNTVNGGM